MITRLRTATVYPSCQPLALLGLASSLLVGCERSDDLPPKALEIASEQHAPVIQECISSVEGEAAFPGLSYVSITNKGPPNSDLMFVTDDGTWILNIL